MMSGGERRRTCGRESEWRGSEAIAIDADGGTVPVDVLDEIQHALAGVDPSYCALSALDYRGDMPVYAHQIKYLERPFAYELYHVLRCRMADWPPDSELRLQAEVDKRYQHILEGECAPDFLIHKPGDISENCAVVEIKRALSGLAAAREDQDKLRRFLLPPLSYRHVIQIIVGHSAELDTVVGGLLDTRHDVEHESVFSLDLGTRAVARY